MTNDWKWLACHVFWVITGAFGFCLIASVMSDAGRPHLLAVTALIMNAVSVLVNGMGAWGRLLAATSVSR